MTLPRPLHSSISTLPFQQMFKQMLNQLLHMKINMMKPRKTMKKQLPLLRQRQRLRRLPQTYQRFLIRWRNSKNWLMCSKFWDQPLVSYRLLQLSCLTRQVRKNWRSMQLWKLSLLKWTNNIRRAWRSFLDLVEINFSCTVLTNCKCWTNSRELNLLLTTSTTKNPLNLFVSKTAGPALLLTETGSEPSPSNLSS